MEEIRLLLDKLEKMLRTSKKFFGSSIINTKEFLSLISKLRTTIDKNFVSIDEVNKLRRELEEKEKQLQLLTNDILNNNEIVMQAYEYANKIKNQANEEAQNIIDEAEKYVYKIMINFEEELKKLLNFVANTKKNIELNLEANKVGVKKVENTESTRSELKKVNIKVK
ncbi:MAG: DivIVA domain-containing protein [bacterium]|nr:DivIVA domain-containing protein [bacterium]